MRLSDADRELLFEKLARHAGAGRIGVEELERRVEAISECATREQAAAVMGDLPPLDDATAKPSGFWRRGRGHGEAPNAAPDWRPTGERFRDPGTDRVMRVWVDADGGRHYVADDRETA